MDPKKISPTSPVLRLQAWLNNWSTSQAVFTLVLVLIACGLAIAAASLL